MSRNRRLKCRLSKESPAQSAGRMVHFPYTLVLTHDVDRLSLRSMPLLGREQLALLRALLLGNLLRWLRGRLDIWDYLWSLVVAVSLPLVLLRLVPDPLERSIELVTTLEDDYGARSTFFFIPLANEPGHVTSDTPAVKHRAASYRLAEHARLVRALVAGGWEVGVHGIDCHISPVPAARERDELAALVGPDYPIGVRMHWLFSSPVLYRNLAQAGYVYDATLGSNDEIGFPEGRYKPFRDDATGLIIVPLCIQDVTLLREDHMNLEPEQAWRRITMVLTKAREHRAVVTVLWHNDSFLPPRCWGGLYRRLLERARDDGARILSIQELLRDEQLL
ncbi:MAG: hypothetical protein ABIL25_05135 [candidate division WOR-3 bacterium]